MEGRDFGKNANVVVCVIQDQIERNVCFGLSAWSLVGKK